MDNNFFLNDNEEATRQALLGLQATMWTALPGYILSVNLTAMTCVVQPTIQGTVTNSSGVKSPVTICQLLDVPIVFPSAGGFTLTFPLTVGDEVLVVFSSRCIDAWWLHGGVQPPAELRMHDLSDGFAIPGPKSQPNVIPNISSTAVQLRNKAGTSYIEINADGSIKLVSPEGFTLTGDLNVTGNIVATGEVTGNAIPLSTHIHPGVTAGGSDTGAPIV